MSHSRQDLKASGIMRKCYVIRGPLHSIDVAFLPRDPRTTKHMPPTYYYPIILAVDHEWTSNVWLEYLGITIYRQPTVPLPRTNAVTAPEHRLLETTFPAHEDTKTP